MRAELRDFVRFPKAVDAAKWKARRFLNAKTGQEISRRDQQTLAKGNIKPEEIARIRKEGGVSTKGSKALRGHALLVKRYKQGRAELLGVKPSQIKVRGDSADAIAFRTNLKKLKKFNADELKKGIKPHLRSDENGAKLARILKDLNLKDEDDDRKPGDYPTNVEAL